MEERRLRWHALAAVGDGGDLLDGGRAQEHAGLRVAPLDGAGHVVDAVLEHELVLRDRHTPRDHLDFFGAADASPEQEAGVLAHQVLGCRGVSRADMRLEGDTFYMLEVNTQPGLTPTSLVPEQAAYIGLPFEDLMYWMVEHAQCDA